MKKNKKLLVIVSVIVLIVTITSFIILNNKVMKQQNTKTDTKGEVYQDFLYDVSNSIQTLDSTQELSTAKTDFTSQVRMLQNKYNNNEGVTYMANDIINKTVSSDYDNTLELKNALTVNVNSIFDSILKLHGGGTKLSVDQEATIKSDNVCKFAAATGKSASNYCVDLHANIYYASKETKNWALLVHGNMMSASSMASAVGKMYLDNNINVLAIDLRGFGSSKGSVAMGFLESLDVMNWLDYLNTSSDIKSATKPEKIIIHGVSLGGATTIQSLTMGGVNVTGVGTMPAISSKNVVGVVDDCGYTSMNGIITSMLPSVDGNKNTISKNSSILYDQGSGYNSWGANNKNKTNGLGSLGGLTLNGSNINIKDTLIKTVLTGNLIKTGLSSNNFDLYQDSFGNGRTVDSKVKVMVVHGGGDTTVPPSNADTLIGKANGNVIVQYRPDGSPHAFIIVGQHKKEYNQKVTEFVKALNMVTANDKTSSGNGFLNFFKKFGKK